MPKFTIRIVQALLLFIPIFLAFVKTIDVISLLLPAVICFGMAAVISLLQSINEKLGG